MAVENARIPSQQQKDDDSILEMIADYKLLTRRKQILANEYQLWLQVITIADRASNDGDSIPFDHLTGKWQAQPNEKFT